MQIGSANHTATPSRAQFPPYEQVIPEFALATNGADASGVVRILSSYLVDALNVCSPLGRKSNAPADIVVRSAMDPMCVSASDGGGESVLVVIMPIRR
jgi:hypothetical protein